MREDRLRIALERLVFPSSAIAVVSVLLGAIWRSDGGLDTSRFEVAVWRATLVEAVVLLGSSALLGAFVALVAWGLDRAMHARPGRGLALTTLLAAVPSAYVARGLAEGEGVEDFGVPMPVAMVLATLALTALGALVAGLAVSPRAPRSVLARLLLAPLLAALVWLTSIAARTYGGLAMLAFVYACVGTTAAFVAALRLMPRVGPWVTAALTATIGLFTLAGLGLLITDPRELLVARHDTLATSPLVLRLDVPFGRDDFARRAARYDVSRFGPGDCVPDAAPALARRNPADTSGPNDGALPRPRNVLLVSIDALRREIVGRAEQGRPIAPRLDALMHEFSGPREAYSNYAATFFSVGSALTGLAPGRMLLAPAPPRGLLTELEGRVDHVTMVLPSSPFFRRPAFARYVVQGAPLMTPGDAEAQTDAVLGFVRDARRDGGSFAAWVHFAEPHAPYEPHPDFDFGADAMQRYFGEVAAADAALGRLLDTLGREGALDETLVIVFSDHGESLGERNHVGHHVFLNRWIVEVPFVVRLPTAMQGPLGFEVDSGVAEVADIAPTVYTFLGITPPHRTVGRSLIRRPGVPSRIPAPMRPIVSEAFSTGGPWLADLSARPVHDRAELARRVSLVNDGFDRYPPSVSLTLGRHRLIVGRTTGFVELFDWVTDPAERHDLGLERPALRRRLLAELARWHREQSRQAYCALEPAAR